MEDEEDGNTDRCKKYKIILWGLTVHFLLLLAVFDVYFASPLDQGMIPKRSVSIPPAKRLVLFVADGLRAEAVYGEDKEYLTPFLSEIIRKKSGTWGVSNTRVPTESRPGHVAMLAGIYEDPSAILKGWKANPVYFDSVINQSVNSWSWGSPDIVNLFNKDKLSKIHLYTYGSEMEDFGKNNTGLLDLWVYNKVKFFLENVKNCVSDCETYLSEGNFFFLHLLGIDTAGHGYKPYSKEYKDNIKLVDSIIKNVTELFETVYKDSSTAFVFTSDHGMTDWGSHGAGSEHETEVPIIAWGSGIQVNQPRRDINQIDIAPLLSTLIGVNIPINSLGVLPVNYLKMKKERLTEALSSNFLQLLEIYHVKNLRVLNNAIYYLPYHKNLYKLFSNKTKHLAELVAEGHVEEFQRTLETEYMELIPLLIKGIEYYHNYYQYPILISISAGFILWIFYLLTSIFVCKTNDYVLNKYYTELTIISIVFVLRLCYKQNFPLTYYLYFSFPVIMFFTILRYCNKSNILNIFSLDFKTVVLNIVLYFIGIELLIYGFFNRTAFSILMIIVGFWVFISKSLRRNSTKQEKCLWVACCLVLAIFPALPVMKTSFNVPVYVIGYVGWLLLFKAVYLKKIKSYTQLENIHLEYRAFSVQFLCLLFSGFYVLLIEFNYITPDSPLKYISWFILLLPISMIPLTSTFIAVRLIATFFAFAPFYLLVSSNYEILFSLFYAAFLNIWLLIESKTFPLGNISNIIFYTKFDIYKAQPRIDSDTFRRSFLFIVLIFLGFFGTGNIASLNSFDPMWVRAFLTVFSPFKMMGLILLKLMVPFIFACCVFRAINAAGKESVLNTFCIILVFSDLMVLQFLYLITNVGSWLDIGTSLSHFIIMEGFVTILLLLYGIAHLLTTVTYKIRL